MKPFLFSILLLFILSCCHGKIRLASPASERLAKFLTGRVCTTDTECADNAGAYCIKDKCDDKKGHCLIPPSECDDVHKPVCGCDGKTYQNQCNAMGEHASIDYFEVCQRKSGKCRIEEQCKPDEMCTRTGGCEAIGMCEKVPEVCEDVYNPVCGCDSKTYPNSCQALKLRVNVRHIGACKPPPGVQTVQEKKEDL